MEPPGHSCIAQHRLHQHKDVVPIDPLSLWRNAASGGKLKEMVDRLNPIELFMWRVSHDPTLRMTVGNLMILDRPPASSGAGRTVGIGSRPRTPTPPDAQRRDQAGETPRLD